MATIRKEQLAGMGMHYKYRTLEYFLQAQKELGLKSIEVWCARPHFLLDDYDYDDPKAFREKVESYGLTIGVFSPECTVYNYNLCAWEETAARHSMGYFENGIRAAVGTGAKLMVVNCCGGARDEEPERVFDRAVSRLKALAKTAADQGVTLAVETVRPDDSHVFNTLPELVRLLDAVGEDSVQASVDLTAAGMAGESLKDWFETLGKRLRHIRFVDGRPQGRLAWGDGLRPLEDHVEWINQYGYQGYLSLALNDARYFDDPREADRKNMAALAPFIQ